MVYLLAIQNCWSIMWGGGKWEWFCKKKPDVNKRWVRLGGIQYVSLWGWFSSKPLLHLPSCHRRIHPYHQIRKGAPNWLLRPDLTRLFWKSTHFHQLFKVMSENSISMYIPQNPSGFPSVPLSIYIIIGVNPPFSNSLAALCPRLPRLRCARDAFRCNAARNLGTFSSCPPETMVFCRGFPWNGGVFYIFFYCIILGGWDYSNQHNIGVNIKHLLKKCSYIIDQKKDLPKKRRSADVGGLFNQKHSPDAWLIRDGNPAWHGSSATSPWSYCCAASAKSPRCSSSLPRWRHSSAVSMEKHGTDGDLKNFWMRKSEKIYDLCLVWKWKMNRWTFESWIVHRCVNEKLNFIDPFECCQWYSWECSWCHRGCAEPWSSCSFSCDLGDSLSRLSWKRWAFCGWRNLFLGYAGIPNFHQYKKKLPQKKRQPTMLFKVRRTLWLSVSMPVLSSLFMSACWGFNILQAVWANPKTRLCARARTQAVRTPPNTLWHFHGINVQHDYTFVSRHEIQKWLRPNVLSWIFQGQFDQ